MSDDDAASATPQPAPETPAAPGAPAATGDAASLSARVDKISQDIDAILARFSNGGTGMPPNPVPGPSPTPLSNIRLAILLALGGAMIVAAYFIGRVDQTIAVALVLIGAVTLVGVISAAVPNSWAQFLEFTRSGIFFIALGLGLLLFTFLWMEATHSALTFLLVVLGVAILLYGTGTQSLGSASSDNATIGKYNVAIAGGAGIIAFAVAFGIVEYSEKINDAFRPDRKYARLVVKADGEGLATLENYHFEFARDGVSIPSFRRNDLIEVLLPYRASQFNQDITISYHLSCDDDTGLGSCVINDDLVVKFDHGSLTVDDAWGDFPQIKDVKEIKLIDDSATQEQLQVAEARQAELQSAEATQAQNQPTTDALPTAVPGGFK